MNRKNCLLVLTPLLFVACVNTQPKKEEVKVPLKKIDKVEKEVLQKVKKQVINTPVVQTPSSTTSVSFIKNKAILEEGMMHIETIIGSLKPSLGILIQLNGQKKMSVGACSHMARNITTDYNNLITNIQIKRTALEDRTSQNKPDKMDKMVIDSLKSDPLVIELKNSYRVYQPIASNDSYLLCNGESNNSTPIDELQGAIVAEIKK